MTFKGIHSSSLGLIMRSINRPILPLVQDEYVDVPGRNGSILFPGSLSDRFIEIQFSFVEKSIPDLREKAHQIADWLYSEDREPIIFDDEPQYTYMGKVANQVDLEQIARAGTFVVTFRCLPYVTTTPEHFDQTHEYDTGLIYPNEGGFTWNFATLHTSGLYNYGQPTWLKITIQGTILTDIKVTNVNTNSTLVVPPINNQTLLIDGEELKAYIDDVEVTTTGDFPNLQSGDNGLLFEGGTRQQRPNAVVSYEWLHHVL